MPSALVALAVGTTAASIYSGEKSRSAQRKATKAQERQSRLQSARDAMSQVRQQRIAQAQVMQAGATQGTQSSSAVQGGYSAIGSLTSGNMQFINQMDNISSQVNSLMRKSNRYAGNAQAFSGLANLAMTGASMLPSGSTPAPVTTSVGVPTSGGNVNYGTQRVTPSGNVNFGV